MIYFRSKDEQQRWHATLKQALQQTTIEDHLSLEGHTLGQGQFGKVKLGVDPRSGLKVAVKCVRKRDLKIIEMYQ